MKDTNANSFRRKDRKVIAESKSQRDAARASASQEELLGGIHGKLGDVQASSEMTSEAVENKANEIVGALADVVASTELTAEAVEKGTGELRKINDIASQISDKLSKLTTVLENKFSADASVPNTSSSTGTSNSTALAVISEAIPDIQTDQEKITQAIEDLLPQLENNQPDADFGDEPPAPVPEPVPEDEKKVPAETESDKGKDGKGLSDKVGALLKVTKDGFKTSIGFSDKIASMLFKYTVTAAIEAAKMAAMILSLVLAIDVIKINFQYWAKLFETNFTEFSKKAGEWEPLLKDIITSVNEVKAAWEKGDWTGLTISIVKGVGKAIYNLTEMIVLGISKLMAALMRQIPGMGDRADAMEADALKTYQSHTGSRLSDEDANLVATQDVKQMNEKHQQEIDSPSLTNAADKIKLAQGQMTLEEYNKRNAQRSGKDYDPFYSMSPEDQVKAVKARNEAQASIERVSDYLDKADMDNPNFKKSADGAVADVQNQMNSPELNKSPELKAELQSKFDELNKKYAALNSKKVVVSPESSKETPEAKTADRINSSSNDKPEASPQGGNYTNVNNISKKTSNNFSLPTQSATVAPGVFGHTSQVN